MLVVVTVVEFSKSLVEGSHSDPRVILLCTCFHTYSKFHPNSRVMFLIKAVHTPFVNEICGYVVISQEGGIDGRLGSKHPLEEPVCTHSIK